MHLISLVGFKGSGKDTVGRFLVQNYGFKNFSFAESLKDAVASIFCWDREMIEGETAESRAWRELVDPWWSEKLGIPGFTPRYAMQNFGTDVMRRYFNEDIWILNIERKLTMLPADTKVVLIDGRFPNELDLGRKFGGRVIRVKRGPEPEWFETARIANSMPRSPPKNKREESRVIEAAKAFNAMNSYGVHISEWAWIGQPLDYTIENDFTIPHLQTEALRVCL